MPALFKGLSKSARSSCEQHNIHPRERQEARQKMNDERYTQSQHFVCVIETTLTSKRLSYCDVIVERRTRAYCCATGCIVPISLMVSSKWQEPSTCFQHIVRQPFTSQSRSLDKALPTHPLSVSSDGGCCCPLPRRYTSITQTKPDQRRRILPLYTLYRFVPDGRYRGEGLSGLCRTFL